jgi:hypothetical protein
LYCFGIFSGFRPITRGVREICPSLMFLQGSPIVDVYQSVSISSFLCSIEMQQALRCTQATLLPTFRKLKASAKRKR